MSKTVKNDAGFSDVKPAPEAVGDISADDSFVDAEAFLKTCKKVHMRIPLSDPNDKVVVVGYNGYMMLIKRGETVEVPEPVYEILRQSGRFF